MRACPHCGQGAPDGARFCSACGGVLASPTEARQERRKIVTVVFCDLSGSTSLGERLDPESVRRIITRYFDAMREALERHGGTVEKFIGDAVMAVFGVPTVREDDALRAVRAAADMQSVLGELNEQLALRFGVRLRVRTGVNTGEVIAGDPSQGHGFVTGDAVNVAARLEQAAPEGEVLLGERTVELVGDAAEVEPVRELDLKGKSEPVPAFRLVGVTARAQGADSQLSAPLVGREHALALLEETWERAVGRRRCELVTILGSAGVGKSRLAWEFAGPLREGAMVVAGRCLSYGEGLTFRPLREVVEGLAGIDAGDSAEDARAAIERVLPEDEDAATVVERVAGALGLSETRAYPDETFWAVRRLLETAARRRPLVVVLEDLHWGEATFIELVEHLAGAVGDAPMLMVAVARDDLLDARPDFAGKLANATRIALEPLSGDESWKLIEQLVGDRDVPADVLGRAFAAGEGNPLFLEELVRSALEERQLGSADSGSSLVGGSLQASAPPTVHALLAARLERLDAAERALVDAAAVVGESFSAGALLALGDGEDRAEVDSPLRALVRKDLVAPEAGRLAGEQTFSFRHILIRDVAYRAMLKEVRADLHERYASWLERAAGERASEHEEILGFHLARAYRYVAELGRADDSSRELAGRAAARLGSSGQRALARGDFGPAAKLLDRAISLLPEDDPVRQDLALKLGIALAETGDLGRADALLHDRLAAERRGRAHLVFHDSAGKRHAVDLDEDSATTIGRLEESDVALSWDAKVSRQHAELRRLPEGWSLVDEGSSNGSLINGEPVRGRHPLRDGDVLRFGDTIVLFRAPVAEERPVVAVRPGEATTLGELPDDLGAPPEGDSVSR